MRPGAAAFARLGAARMVLQAKEGKKGSDAAGRETHRAKPRIRAAGTPDRPRIILN